MSQSACRKKTILWSKSDFLPEFENAKNVGGTTIYNPWSIVEFIQEEGRLEPYWVNTSGNDLIRKLRAGDSLSDDVIESLLKVIDYDFLAKSLVDQSLLGNQLNVNINKIIETLKKDASRYDELILKMNRSKG